MDLHGLSEKLMIIAVIALFFTLFFTTGAFSWVTGSISGTCENICADSDAGSEFTKGTIEGYNFNCIKFEKTDYCSEDDPMQLKEYRCDTTRKQNWYSEIVTCEKGCKDGTCIK